MGEDDLAELDAMLTEYEVYASYGGRPEPMQACIEELEIALSARVPGLVAEVRRLRAEVAALEASVEALRRHWEAERAEVARLCAVAAAARAVSDGVDSVETAEANLLRALDAAIDRLDAARA